VAVDVTAPDDVPEPPAPPPAPLLELRDGLPFVVESATALSETVGRFGAATGPVGVDAERASGYRYSPRAYLVQLRRAGAGTALIDPIPLGDLRALGTAIADEEWILHAASQDLACLAEVGMQPRVLFDTELAGRLLNYPRVGLAALVELVLGFRMRKEHSSVDWSIRPMPQSWLVYAALDVEMLIELRDVLAAQLADEGKLGWAREEFAWLVAAPPTKPRTEPWRRTSGIHRVRGRRALAGVRALWQSRDELAREHDIAPGRLLKDAAICEAATANPKSRNELAALPSFRSRPARRHLPRWADALESARRLPDADLPEISTRYDGPPPARAWPEKDPDAAARLSAARETLSAIAQTHRLPTENLLAPDYVRRLAWEPPEEVTARSVADVLAGLHARPWQIDLTASAIAVALST
jgi:ribonuclease D